MLTATVVVREKKSAGRQLLLDAKCINQLGETVTEGTLLVDCPAERRSVQRLGEVEVAFHRYNAFQAIFERAQGEPPVRRRWCIPVTRSRCSARSKQRRKG